MTKTLFKESARELKEHPWLEEDRDTGLIRVRVSDGGQQAVLIFAWGQIGTDRVLRTANARPKARKRTPEAK